MGKFITLPLLDGSKIAVRRDLFENGEWREVEGGTLLEARCGSVDYIRYAIALPIDKVTNLLTSRKKQMLAGFMYIIAGIYLGFLLGSVFLHSHL